MAYSGDEQEVFLGRSVTQSKNISDKTADVIDAEIRRIVDEAYSESEKILKKNNIELERLALGLLEYETLNGEGGKIIVEGGSLSRNENDDDVTPTPRQKRPRTGLQLAEKAGNTMNHLN